MKQIVAGIGILLIFSGCSKPETDVTMADAHKSCNALQYEETALKERKFVPEDVNLSTADYLHRAAVTGGVIASLNPANLFGPYFYVIPVMTIWYYNYFFKSSREDLEAEKIEARLKTLKMLKNKKRCNEDNN